MGSKPPATYTVNDDFGLSLYKGMERNIELYSKNGLRVVPYDETFDGDMIYRILDKNDLDPVGDGFRLQEAIEFADSYPVWKLAN